MLWGGRVVEGADGGDDPDTVALRAYNLRLAGDSRLLTTFVPIGDGLSVSVKLRREVTRMSDEHVRSRSSGSSARR